jgi:ComF family protein
MPRQIIQTTLNFVLDLVFPPTCHGCGKVDARWCTTCQTMLQDVPLKLKDIAHPALDGLCATGHHKGKLQDAIQALKYYNVPELAKPLGKRLADTIAIKDWTFDTIIPVPLFASRFAKRGYNQSYLLSQQVVHMPNITVQPHFLTRQRDTEAQVGLTASERYVNVKDAFIANPAVAGLSVLIIDDVVTTGSTLGACAKALKSAGANAVYAMTVTHA